jgi:hypothetical protein
VTTCQEHFQVVFDPMHKIKIDQVIAGKATGVMELTCPQQHKVMVDCSDKSSISVRGK